MNGKLGRINSEGFPLLINNVFDESLLKEWANEKSIGHLQAIRTADERLVGVTMFARQSFDVSL